MANPTAFRSEVEYELASLWQRVLNTEFLPQPSDDFFSLGGDSVAMILTELQIKDEFSVDLPEGAMLGVASLRELSLMIEAHRKTEDVWERTVADAEQKAGERVCNDKDPG